MTIKEHPQRTILETSELWDNDFISDNWEQKSQHWQWPLNKEWQGQHSQFLRCFVLLLGCFGDWSIVSAFFGCCFSIFLCICVCLLVFLSMFFHLFELPFLWEEEAFILLFLGAELELPGSYKQVGTLQTLCKKQNSCFRLRTAGNTSIPFTTVRKKAGRIRFLYIYSTFTFWKKSSCFLPDICIKPVCQYFRQSSRENRNFCSCTKFRFRSTPNLGTWKRKCEKLSCQI